MRENKDKTGESVARVLVLDDMAERHEVFKKKLAASIDHAVLFSQAQQMILNNDPYDTIFLDHDLGDAQENADYFVDEYGRRVEYNGAHFAYWLVHQRDKLPKNVIVHSVNPDGAKRIEATLRAHRIPVDVIPFTSLVHKL